MAEHSKIRVVVDHQNPLTQAGLAHVLSRYDDLEVIDGRGRRHLDAESVVMTNFSLGIDRLRQAPAGVSAPKIFIVTGSARESEILQALKLGACGFVNASCDLSELVAGVRQSLTGKVYLCSETARALMEGLFQDALTERELVVLGHLSDALCNKEIATRMHLAVGTVKSHLRSIFSKLGVESRTQAIVVAERRGLLRSGSVSENAATSSPGWASRDDAFRCQ